MRSKHNRLDVLTSSQVTTVSVTCGVECGRKVLRLDPKYPWFKRQSAGRRPGRRRVGYRRSFEMQCINFKAR